MRRSGRCVACEDISFVRTPGAGASHALRAGPSLRHPRSARLRALPTGSRPLVHRRSALLLGRAAPPPSVVLRHRGGVSFRGSPLRLGRPRPQRGAPRGARRLVVALYATSVSMVPAACAPCRRPTRSPGRPSPWLSEPRALWLRRFSHSTVVRQSVASGCRLVLAVAPCLCGCICICPVHSAALASAFCSVLACGHGERGFAVIRRCLGPSPHR